MAPSEARCAKLSGSSKMKKVLGALALIGFASIAQAEGQPVTVILSSASTMTQGMAMVLANQMQAQGGQVDILLCDAAGDLALKDAAGEALKPQNVTSAQLLDAAMAKGATASVCALYLPNSGKQAGDLKAGIAAAKPDDMGRALLEPQRKVMAF
jgi:predicted peroxiredoxin